MRKASAVIPVIVFGIALLIAGGAVILTFKSNHEAQIEANQAQERVALETLKNCIRGNFISATFRRDNTTVPVATQEHLYPILDCKRSQLSGKLVAIPADETDKYIDLVRQGRAPIINEGKVIGSRRSLLDGINTIKEVGTLPE